MKRNNYKSFNPFIENEKFKIFFFSNYNKCIKFYLLELFIKLNTC